MADELVIRMGDRWEDRYVDPDWKLVLGALNDGVITPAIAKAWMFGEDGTSFRKLDGGWVHETEPCGCQSYTGPSGSNGGTTCCCLDERCDGKHAHEPAPWSRGTTPLRRRHDDDKTPDFLDCLRAAGYEVPEPEKTDPPGLPF